MGILFYNSGQSLLVHNVHIFSWIAQHLGCSIAFKFRKGWSTSLSFWWQHIELVVKSGGKVKAIMLIQNTFFKNRGSFIFFRSKIYFGVFLNLVLVLDSNLNLYRFVLRIKGRDINMKKCVHQIAKSKMKITSNKLRIAPKHLLDFSKINYLCLWNQSVLY